MRHRSHATASAQATLTVALAQRMRIRQEAIRCYSETHRGTPGERIALISISIRCRFTLPLQRVQEPALLAVRCVLFAADSQAGAATALRTADPTADTALHIATRRGCGRPVNSMLRVAAVGSAVCCRCRVRWRHRGRATPATDSCSACARCCPLPPLGWSAFVSSCTLCNGSNERSLPLH